MENFLQQQKLWTLQQAVCWHPTKLSWLTYIYFFNFLFSFFCIQTTFCSHFYYNHYLKREENNLSITNRLLKTLGRSYLHPSPAGSDLVLWGKGWRGFLAGNWVPALACLPHKARLSAALSVQTGPRAFAPAGWRGSQRRANLSSGCLILALSRAGINTFVRKTAISESNSEPLWRSACRGLPQNFHVLAAFVVVCKRSEQHR